MRIKVGSRKSDLARWQAVQVARILEVSPAKPSIEFLFKSSLGDQNLDIPLAGMGAKGVFTEDFHEDLLSGRCDLVVHSWKDLPIEDRSDTRIAMTLARADVRDVLLVPETVWQKTLQTGKLEILTSSPRRVYNLTESLRPLLPSQPELVFKNVRGNVPTRLKKMHAEGCALVLAKAGLDRLLQAEKEGFVESGSGVLALLQNTRFQILPVSLNPPAPAQGALAVEVAANNETMQNLCAALTDEKVYSCVRQEREILKRHGGGCHQKIGVAVLPRPYGMVRALRGLTDQGQTLFEWHLENNTSWVEAKDPKRVFPTEAKQNSWFKRRPLSLAQSALAEREAFFVARADAWPESLRPSTEQQVWCAGVQTWARLAALGIWVNGCQDGLGELEPMGWDFLHGEKSWTKLTHTQSVSGWSLATYELEAKEPKDSPDLRGKTHFYWMSRTSFERAQALFPEEIAAGRHACGPGLTYDFLKAQTGLKYPVKVFIGLEQFLSETLPAR